MPKEGTNAHVMATINAMIKDKKVESVEDLLNTYALDYGLNEFLVVYRNRACLEELLRRKNFQPKLQPPHEELDDLIRDLDFKGEPWDLIRQIGTHSAYYKYLYVVAKRMVVPINPKDMQRKRRGIYLYGAPNSGKSSLTEILQNIFKTCKVMQFQKSFATQDMTPDSTRCNLVWFDEITNNDIFNGPCLEQAKTLFEGQGMVINKKNEQPWRAF